MTTNCDITVFNKRYDKAERTERLYGTKIRDVSFYSKKAASSADKQLSQGDSYTIRIPADADTDGKQYIEQQAYSSLDEEAFKQFWTLQPGAIIVSGLADQETTTEVELQKAYADMIVVTNFTDNRSRGSESMWHWRVGGE